jgi:hypothetical protein
MRGLALFVLAGSAAGVGARQVSETTCGDWMRDHQDALPDCIETSIAPAAGCLPSLTNPSAKGRRWHDANRFRRSTRGL